MFPVATYGNDITAFKMRISHSRHNLTLIYTLDLEILLNICIIHLVTPRSAYQNVVEGTVVVNAPVEQYEI
jgi:hypothetical protein